jgi:ABC-2 type transport system ATP-binding protein
MSDVTQLAIEVVDFRKEYAETVAANGISFTLPRGVIGALVGPNGAGKTTTMRSLCGVLKPTSGILRVAGYDVQRHPLEVKQRVAYVPDDPPLFETLTVWEHIEFIASAYGVANYRAVGEELLTQFELIGKRNALASELSRGMRQKVAIACAYLHQPEVMLFDEPLTGLDPAAIRMLKESMRRRAAEGQSVLVSSHLLALVEDICQHLIIFQHGKCLFSGTLAEARSSHPDTQSLEDVFFRYTEGQAPC